MAAEPRNTPTTRGRELAERLRELRLAADMTVESVAESLLVSPSKISRLETATRRASQRDVRDLCLLYRVPTVERDRLMQLSAQALETTWYQDAAIRTVYGTFIGLEEAASQIDIFHSFVVGGLLQTEEYARNLIAGIRPPGFLSVEETDEILRVRMRRREVLESPNPPRYHVVMDEMTFRRPVGGPPVMARQVRRVLELGSLPHVVVQIVPLSVGSYPGLDGRFCVLRFANQPISDTVYVEGLLGELFLDKDTDVARYSEIFDYLASTVALDEGDSRRLLMEIEKDWSV